MKIRDLIEAVRILPKAYACYVVKLRDDLERDYLTVTMERMGVKWGLGNPAYDIGTALEDMV